MNYSHSDDSTLKSFRETYKDLERVYDSFSKICGLSNTEYWALLMIYEGVATQHDISESLCLSRQTVNSAFRRLHLPTPHYANINELSGLTNVLKLE